jgi:N4-bis(aminopropyl)spermidine synthase
VRKEIDLREAINAVSDVVQNRPRPLREFDQIYMKTGDMVLQSEFVSSWADDKRLAFIGDGDAISVCVAYLKKRGIVDYGPSRITVFDFDERTVQAVKRFADKERLEHLDAVLYNCLEKFPQPAVFDAFYTNPPWGASNNGESVNIFTQRGMEAIGYHGAGMIIIADDEELNWPKQVLGTRFFRPRWSISSTGQSSHILIRCTTRRSTIRRATDFRRSVCGMLPK